MEFLVSKGMSIDGVDEGMTMPPLSRAIAKNHKEAIHWLLDNGANINGNKYRAPPISYAIQENNIDLIKFLLAKGARLDISWSDGYYNVVSFAHSFGDERKEIIQLLEAHTDNQLDEARVKTPHSEFDTFLKENFGSPDRLRATRLIAGASISVTCVSINDNSGGTLVVTDGLSRLSMPCNESPKPDGPIELAILLSPEWSIAEIKADNVEENWPVIWLLNLAEYVSQEGLGFSGDAFVVSNGEPPEPVTPKSNYTCFLGIENGLSASSFVNTKGQLVQLYCLLPITTPERDHYFGSGATSLFDALKMNGVTACTNKHRTSII